jgi:serine/threonine-protein kinase RsbW
LSVRVPAPALPVCLSEMRRRVAEWARAVGLAADIVDDVVLATNEALTNVAEHAYPDGRGDAALHADCLDGVVRVVVRDFGRWRDPAVNPGSRGHGLGVIHGLPEQVDVRHGAGGTRVEMRWHL